MYKVGQNIKPLFYVEIHKTLPKPITENYYKIKIIHIQAILFNRIFG